MNLSYSSVRFARLLGILIAVCASLYFVTPSPAQQKVGIQLRPLGILLNAF